MTMKIVAGMGSLDDYEDFCEAGADEVFTGYVPLNYMECYGREKPINRREVIYYNVSLGSFSELLILNDMKAALGKEVSIAFNAIALSDSQREEIVEIIRKCIKAGYTHFIIADLKLIKMLEDIDGIFIEISGELGEPNHLLFDELSSKNLSRFIFPRQSSIEEIENIISLNPNKKMEYEAFLLNEKCHFTGAYCNSVHCDELCHICKVPYKVKGMEIGRNIEETTNIPGETGCGLCALWDLRKAGITHLKLVSRGNSGEETVKDIKTIKEALKILDGAKNKNDYIANMKKRIFPLGCSHNCYYTIDKEDK